MSDIVIPIQLPIDDDGFLRRECPLCVRQFKVETSSEEQQSWIQNELDAYLLQSGISTESEELDTESENEDDVLEFLCPYCGQLANYDHWWTQEQLAYIHVFAHNIMAQIVNEAFKPLKRRSSTQKKGMFSIEFSFEEMSLKNPWISPEINDMSEYKLPCCQAKIKLIDEWQHTFYCYKCGFPHELKKE